MNTKELLCEYLTPVMPLLEDDEVSDIYINGADDIFYKPRFGRIRRGSSRFSSANQLLMLVKKIALFNETEFSDEVGIIDGVLPIGTTRVNVTTRPVFSGISLTIRKFPEKPFTADDLLSLNALDDNGCEILKFLVFLKKRILIIGSTGTGKTTLLNVLCSFIARDSGRILIIEDTPEIMIDHPNVLRQVSSVNRTGGKKDFSFAEVLKNALRQDPEFIIPGEIRDHNVFTLINLLSTGHSGFSTFHAGSSREALDRLIMLISQFTPNFDYTAIRNLVKSAIDVIVLSGKLRDNSRKILEISEIEKSFADSISLNQLYRFVYQGTEKNRITDEFSVSNRPSFLCDDLHLFSSNDVPAFWRKK